MNKKRLSINLLSNTFSFMVATGISFVLTPYITTRLGKEAYGFVALGNNFVSYARIITLALNAMASRFITIRIYENRLDEARQYFSSVIIANVIIAGVLLLPGACIVIFTRQLFQISDALVADVQLLWIFTFFSFLINIIGSAFETATFVKNRLDLSARRDAESNLIRAALLLIMFSFLIPHVYYIGLAMVLSAFFVIATNVRYTRILLPDMKFQKKLFRMSAIKDLLYSGVWSSISSLSATLLSGLDLLIANLFINSEAMGVLAIAKVVPHALSTLITKIQTVFVPELTKMYAQKKLGEMTSNIRFSIKVLSILSSIPLTLLFVFGAPFFRLWVPTVDAQILQLLSVLTVGALLVTSAIKPLYTVYVITNKVKLNSISMLVQGILSSVTVILLLLLLPDDVINRSDLPWGLIIIAGVSSTYGVVRALTFVPILAARCLNLHWSAFYGAIGRSLVNIAVQCAIGIAIASCVAITSWPALIITGAVTALINLTVTFLIVLNAGERKRAFQKIVKLLKKQP